MNTVPIDLLEALAGPKPEAKPATNGNGKPYNGEHFDLRRWISRFGLDVGPEKPFDGGGWCVELNKCPFSDAHFKGAIVGQRGDGAIVASCRHNSCHGKKWPELREIFEPGYRDRKSNHQPNGNSHTGGEEPKQPEPIRYERLTCAELDANRYTTEFLIDKLLVAGQPCIVAGGKKTLKTSLLIALALALATCRDFLAYFRVMRTAKVALMTGESGLATIQETARRIALSMGLVLAEVKGLIISPDLPRFGDARHMDALREFLTADEIEVVIVDPAYLAIPTDGNEASLFAMGGLLRGMVETCNSVGAMLILAHHTKKTITDPFAPPELEHIAWSGFPEFARQWLLVGRREAYEPGTGDHRLWLNVGGSAGHSGCYAVDVSEGVYDGRNPRRWELAVMLAGEARQDAKARQEQAKQAERQAKASAQLDVDRAAIVRAMVQIGKPEMATKIRDWAGLGGGKRFPTVWATLIADGTIIETGEVVAGNHKPAALYQLKKDTDE